MFQPMLKLFPEDKVKTYTQLVIISLTLASSFVCWRDGPDGPSCRKSWLYFSRINHKPGESRPKRISRHENKAEIYFLWNLGFIDINDRCFLLKTSNNQLGIEAFTCFHPWPLIGLGDGLNLHGVSVKHHFL